MGNQQREMKSSDPVNARRFYLSLAITESTRVVVAIKKAKQPDTSKADDTNMAWVTLNVEQAMEVHQHLGDLIAEVKGRLP